MVTRKPVPENAQIGPIPASQPRVSQTQDESSQDVPGWENVSEPAAQHDRLVPEDVPEVLRPGSRQSASHSSLEEENVWVEEPRPLVLSEGSGLAPMPSVLRPGNPKSKAETNPFLKRKMSGPSPTSSQEAVYDGAEVPQPPPLAPPIASFSNLSLGETSNNPWQPALDEKRPVPVQSSLMDVSGQETSKEVWGSRVPSRQPSGARPSHSPALLSLPSDDGPAPWSEEAPSKSGLPPILIEPANEPDFEEDNNVWDEVAKPNKGKAIEPQGGPSGPGDDWDTLDDDLQPSSKHSIGEKVGDTAEKVPAPSLLDQPAQEGPAASGPGGSSERPPPPPPRPPPDGKSETYQIKNINWHDVKAATNPRTSPILVQNANGPCPLVALVNALILTTPAEVRDTALVETLRSREQVSLGLLLDAVFDELMSPRRTHEDAALPDVGELYDFLKGLHTGMNVNPRFIPSPEIVKMFKRTSLTHLHPSERGDMIPGTFEDTKEMALYATFSIPLIHGWLPPRSDVVYDALSRRAVSYEDAQNLLSREEELEEKLSSTRHAGLTEEEQEIYQDILTVKSFLSISATQLTQWGLDVITKAMNPGSVAILFRNDHFSTLYRHPQTLELLTLVTDAGYASHDEIVWESLIDVNGERAEFFSGDFLVVGGAHQQLEGGDSSRHASVSAAGTHAENDWPGTDGQNSSEWTTVQGRRGRNRTQTQEDEAPLSPTHEQEDRDLALALQLQEEEEQRARTEQERRRRESLLSEQYIEQQAQQSPAGRGGRATTRGGGRGGGAPTLTPGRRTSSISQPANTPATTTSGAGRGGGQAAASRGRGAPLRQPGQQPVRSLISGVHPATRRPADDNLDDAPPSYEQAAKQTPYVPPEGHPNHPASSPNNRMAAGPSNPPPQNGAQPRRVPTGPPGGFPAAGGPAQGRLRQGVPPQAVAGAGGRDKDCVVM